jgi:antitoxin component of MazEF toxin-antitoxin module
MRSPFESLVTQKALVFVQSVGQPDLVDAMIESDRSIVTKNVCAKVSPELAAQIDEVVQLLGISKRRFLEAAFIEAVRRAKEIMEAEGVYEALDLMQSTASPGASDQEAAA